MLSLVSILERLFAGWSGTYFAVFCGASTAEAMYGYEFSKHLVYAGERWKASSGELAGLFILLQIAGDIEMRVSPLRGTLPRVDGATFALFALVFGCWSVGRDTVVDLTKIGEDPGEQRRYVAPAHRLARRFFSGGILLFAAAGLSQATVARRFELGHAGASGPLLNVLVYVVLGLVMLGQIHHASMWARWQRAGASVPSALSARWLRYTAVFLCCLAALSFALPTSYSLGLLDLLGSMLKLLFATVVLIYVAFAAALGWLFSLLHVHVSTSGTTLRGPPRIPPRLPPPVKHPHHPTHSGTDWFAALRSVLFWVLTASIAIYLLRSFFRQHAVTLRRGGPFGWLARALAQMWGALRRRLNWYAGSSADLWRRRRQSSGISTVRSPRGWLPRPASARAQIVLYFVRLVQRAERVGVHRRPADTPLEFEAQLKDRITIADAGALEALTNAYLEARYSSHPIAPEDAARARNHWQMVRRALRRMRTGSDDAAPGSLSSRIRR